MKIVALDGYTLNPGDNPWDAVAQLGELTVFERTAASDVVERARGASVLLTNKTPISREAMAALPELKFISVLATGFNIVDIMAAKERGIPVSNVPVYGTDAVAQYVFAVLLEMIHQPLAHDRAVRQGEWARRQDFSFWLGPINELAGKVFGVVGFGRIGRRAAEIAHAFGMHVLAYDVHRDHAPNWERFAWAELDDLFSRADVVTLHCPQTEANKGFVNERVLRLMKPTARLINAARGTLVNEQDLAAALNSDKLAGAVLDVVSVEPILPSNPLLNAKNCLLTPHMAWAAVEARRRLMQTTADNIAAFQRGQPIHVVNG